jgi:hypothetical protein
MEDIYPVLAWLITPAVILGVIGYFARFFGKVIADQNPFFDERAWAVELGGFIFTLNLSIGVIGVVAALNLSHLGFGWMHWVNLIVTSLLLTIFSITNSQLFARFYRLKPSTFKKQGIGADFVAVVEFIGLRTPHFLVPIVLGYIGTVEYLSGSIIWTVISWTLIIFTLLNLATNSSLRKYQERVGTDIHFIDSSREPIRDALILKVNEGNIRIRVENKIMILNKDEVFKMEFSIPEEKLPA